MITHLCEKHTQYCDIVWRTNAALDLPQLWHWVLGANDSSSHRGIDHLLYGVNNRDLSDFPPGIQGWAPCFSFSLSGSFSTTCCPRPCGS